MEKSKTHPIICFLLIAVFAVSVQSQLYGQEYLSKEKENEIKMSGNYYWGESSDFIEELAKLGATAELSGQIIQDAVGQTKQLDEILKTIEMGAHLDRIPQQGKIKILAWIPKNGVLLTVTTQRPITQTYEPQPTYSVPAIQPEEKVISPPEIVPMPERNPIATGNPVLQELAACRNYKDVKRVAANNGLVRGEIGKGSQGFHNPENCIIAVFSSNGDLSALLDNGYNSRTDLLSGNTIQNPDRYYNQGEYSLWYMQVKETPQRKTDNIQNNSTSSIRSSQAPPIENTNGYANASVLLPKDWDGTSILADAFVWIGVDDVKLQNKYNVHPCADNESPDCIYGFWDDYETWDDDETYYKYPLSPNVVIEAGIWSENNSNFKTRKMTVNQFADYMRSREWGVEGASEDAHGIITNVTYKNGMITKIVEVYTP